MAVERDLFGFDELEKAFKRLEKRYPDGADALLMAQGQAIAKKIRSETNVKTGKLRKSWRVKKVKLYKNGSVRVVRIHSMANHAHLYELGHEMVKGGKTTISKKGTRRKLNVVQRSARGIKGYGRVPGKFVMQKAIDEAEKRLEKDAQKMLDKMLGELEV